VSLPAEGSSGRFGTATSCQAAFRGEAAFQDRLRERTAARAGAVVSGRLQGCRSFSCSGRLPQVPQPGADIRRQRPLVPVVAAQQGG
jgi:hypothetical protein